MTGYGSQRNLNDNVFAFGSGSPTSFAPFSGFCLDVFLVFQMQQGPELRTSFQDNVTTPTAIAPIGPAFIDVFFPPKMHGTRTTCTGSNVYFYVIYKI